MYNKKGHKNPFYGKHHSEETKKIIGSKQNWKGKKHSIETRQKMSKSATGKTFSKEHLKNLSKAHKGFKHSELSRRKMSLFRRGRKRPEISGSRNVNWRGGLLSISRQILKSIEYRQWRSDIFQRDGYTCQNCGDFQGGNLEAHHIKSKSLIIKENNITSIEQASLCEELWNLNNGITLCKECHKKTDSYGKNK